jgi:UTP--glucose-1-phosphate uridylyltransferase
MSERLEAQLDALDANVVARLSRHHFDRAQFLRLAARVKRETAADNRVSGTVTPPAPGDVTDPPDPGSADEQRLKQRGLEALRKGQVALVVLAGGMATRMGGVVKALVEALPDKTFLDLRLGEMKALEDRVGHAVPLWLMTSAATDSTIRHALGARIDGESVAVFSQYLSLRVTRDGELYVDAHGNPGEYAPGHGDLPDALRESGLLQRFADRGGRVVMVANLDNLGATIDPTIVGFHLDHGADVTCEVGDTQSGDRGGIPVRLDDRPVVLEEFRLPESFDPTTVRVFNTNTFLFNAHALLELSLDWTYFLVEKKADEQPVIQFERLIGEVTSHMDTRFLRVPRDGEDSRFLPTKDHDELSARRDDIERVARARGML